MEITKTIAGKAVLGKARKAGRLEEIDKVERGGYILVSNLQRTFTDSSLPFEVYVGPSGVQSFPEM